MLPELWSYFGPIEVVVLGIVVCGLWWLIRGQFEFPIRRRLRFARALLKQLEVYRSRAGAYPVRSSFSRLVGSDRAAIGQWFPELDEAARGQVPSRIDNNDNGIGQWLYRSNGQDFKLIYFEPSEREQQTILRKFRHLADPERTNPNVHRVGAYGLWSRGAQGW